MAKRKRKDNENPDLLERGQKQRAGRLLSEYLRAIGQEMTEVVCVNTPGESGPPTVQRRLVSKAESLARWMWHKATPHKETDEEGNAIVVEPNLDVVKLVLDRVEGKPGVGGKEDADDRKESVPDRVSRMNADRLNKLASEAMEDE